MTNDKRIVMLNTRIHRLSARTDKDNGKIINKLKRKRRALIKSK